MGFCRAAFHGSKFEAYVNVIGNPGATVTLGNDKYNYYCTCDSNGNGNITINRRGEYKVRTSAVGAFEAEQNTMTININQNGIVYSVQKVLINRGTNSLAVSNEYKSGSLLPYWGSSSTKPSTNFSQYWLVYRTDRAPISRLDGEIIYKGLGEEYSISTTKKVYGYLHNVTVGTTGYYGLFAVLNINGNNYYTGIITASGTAKNMETVTKTFTSSGTMTVPAGMHKLTACAVGGGGGGAHNGHHWFAGSSSDTKVSIGGGGGEGGAVTTTTIDVIPGQSISVVIGGGGAGGNSWWKQVVSDYIDVYNGAGGSNGGTTSITVNGKSISANGGAGAAQVNPPNLSPTLSGGSGGLGGSGRGNGGDGGKGFYARGDRSGDNTAGSGAADYYQGNAGNGGSGAAFDGTWYGGGGGGGGSSCRREPSKGSTFYTYGLSGNGGNRGGGNGGYTSSTPTAGTANTGGGGGGGGSGNYYSSDSSRNGANGGSGVAILKFAA